MTSDALGLTGTRNFSQTDVKRFLFDQDHVVPASLALFNTYVTGACVGFDALMGHALYEMYPEADHLVIVPADRSRVDYWWETLPVGDNLRIFEMAEGTSYRDRNLMIVNSSSTLLYGANDIETATSERRSGTWQTVRLARAAGLPVFGTSLAEMDGPLA